jgi:CheY-like chemotaxis protein
MNLKQLNVLLADDDIDDCVFFKQAVDDLVIPVNFTAVHDGEQLMQHLTNEANALPHVLFLDLNMPRKNGFECLSEIKNNKQLKQLPVIIFSTSFEQGVVDQLYLNGAQYFIRKPSEFAQFKEIIHQTLLLIVTTPADNIGNIGQPEKENFVLILEK